MRRPPVGAPTAGASSIEFRCYISSGSGSQSSRWRGFFFARFDLLLTPASRRAPTVDASAGAGGAAGTRGTTAAEV